ncbi:MAG TPA: NUDIX hydrolase [Pseudonocardiaceae bacterium]
MTDADDAVRFAYLAEGNAKQARKRVSADVLISDAAGRVLLVDPTYKPDWDMPGGMVEGNEPPRVAAKRELREELNLVLDVGRLLYLEWAPPHGPWDDTLVFIFDGGTVDEPTIAALRPADDELSQWAFVDVASAREHLRPSMWERLRQAMAARASGETIYREI